MPLTPESFRAKFPEFTTDNYTDAAVARWIATARTIHDRSLEATGFLTAHLLTIANADGVLGGSPNVAVPDGGAGEVRSETIGPKTIDYMTQARGDGEAFYTRTSYGRTFLEIERRNPERVLSVRAIG